MFYHLIFPSFFKIGNPKVTKKNSNSRKKIPKRTNYTKKIGNFLLLLLLLLLFLMEKLQINFSFICTTFVFNSVIVICFIFVFGSSLLSFTIIIGGLKMSKKKNPNQNRNWRLKIKISLVLVVAEITNNHTIK